MAERGSADLHPTRELPEVVDDDDGQDQQEDQRQRAARAA